MCGCPCGTACVCACVWRSVDSLRELVTVCVLGTEPSSSRLANLYLPSPCACPQLPLLRPNSPLCMEIFPIATQRSEELGFVKRQVHSATALITLRPLILKRLLSRKAQPQKEVCVFFFGSFEQQANDKRKMGRD